METILSNLKELISEYNNLLPIPDPTKKILDKKFRLEFSYNSNHIEGNTLTYGETELLIIFDKTNGSHELREFEEMKAHDVAYHLIQEWAKDEQFQLLEMHIKQLNEIILVRPFWKDAVTPDGTQTRREIKIGQYKSFPNSVRLQNGEIFHYTSPMDTPMKMEELMQWYHDETKKAALHPIILAALFHYKFVCIHPFDDGNGRISRLIVNYILLKNGLPPIVIKSANKNQYLHALSQADSGNIEAFINFITEELIWSLNIYIKALKGDSVEEPDDIDKRLAVLTKELNANDPNEDVKLRYNREVYLGILKGWLGELIKEVIPVIQKFNHLFTGGGHYISLANGYANANFMNETSDQVIEKLWKQILEDTGVFQEWNSSTLINAHYGTLIKGGLNTFTCNYNIEIKFEEIKYTVNADVLLEDGKSTQQKIFERLLHKPLNSEDRKKITDLLAKTVFEHIDFYSRKNGLIKGL